MALDPNTKLILHTGEVKTLAEIKIGDQLMGEDSSPRTVIAIKEIRQKAFMVIPHRGERIVCSEDHPLIVRKSPYLNVLHSDRKRRFRHYPNLLCIRANDLLSRGNSFCRSFLLYIVPIDFKKVPVPIDPYFVGIWLGDGHSHLAGITTMDEQIKREVYKQAQTWGLKVSINTKNGNKASSYMITRGNVKGFSRRKNPLMNALQGLNLIRNKHIPAIYLLNDRQTRLELLAGIIDTDGHYQSNYYSVTQKNKILLDQISQLANSLGFRTTTKKISKAIKSIGFSGTYYSVSISGRIDQIPVKVLYKKATSISPKYDRRAGGYKLMPAGIQKLIIIKTAHDKWFLHAHGTIMSPDSDHVHVSTTYSDKRFVDAWNKRLIEIAEFIKANKRLPRRAIEKERKLRNWIQNALSRQQLLSKKRQSDLLKLGIVVVRKTNFETKFSYLVDYRKANPNRWPINNEQYPQGVNLGTWCRSIRGVYRKGKLSQSRIDKFNEIGFPFDAFKVKCDLQLKYLNEFRITFKRNPFRTEQYPAGNPLGEWYSRHKKKDWMIKM